MYRRTRIAIRDDHVEIGALRTDRTELVIDTTAIQVQVVIICIEGGDCCGLLTTFEGLYVTHCRWWNRCLPARTAGKKHAMLPKITAADRAVSVPILRRRPRSRDAHHVMRSSLSSC